MTFLSKLIPPPPPQKKSRNRVWCQCMTIAKWLLRVLARRERILSWPFRKHGCLHTHDIKAHKGQILLLCKALVSPHPWCTVHKGQILLFCKAWVPPHPRLVSPHPRCTVHKGQILLLCKAWVPPHPRCTACKSSIVRVWVCTHPWHTEGFK